METVCCDLCGADEPQTLYAGSAWEGASPAEVALVRCRRCGLMYLSPRPTTAEIGAFYPQDYMSFRPAVEDERLGLMRWFRRRKLAQRRLAVEEFSKQRSGRVLDVGCATGLFLHEMAESGWEAHGVELTASAADYARQRFGLPVHQGLLEDAPYPAGAFDVVTFWDVLEHTFSPTQDLRLTNRLLRPGGIVAINVPNWHSPDRRIFGPHWIGLDPPRHLYVFTRPTLTALLEKVGFQPLAWRCIMPTYYAFIISVNRWLCAKKPNWAGPVDRLLNFPGVRFPFQPYFTLANALRQGGVITVFAQKTQE